MFARQEIKENLRGCFEIILFMRQGVERFQNVSKKDAIKSFIIPVFFLPLVFAVLIMTSAEGYSVPFLIGVHFARIAVGAIIYLSILYFLSKQLSRQEHFFRFIVIGNWVTVFDFVLVLPVLFYLSSGQDLSGIEPYAVFMTLVGYVYLAFIITNSFRIPWEFGGFAAIVGLAVDETMWDIISFMFGEMSVMHGT